MAAPTNYLVLFAGGRGGQQIETRPGDWECPDCGKVVFKNKSECFSCGAPKPEDLHDGPPGCGPVGGSQKFEARPGDWECPDCGKLVFKNKSECFSCGAPKPEGLDGGFGGGTFRGSQKFEARPGDWECPDCGKLVFKNKSECFSCGAPKPVGLDDGFGGGGSGYGEAPMCPSCACFCKAHCRTSDCAAIQPHVPLPYACLTCLPDTLLKHTGACLQALQNTTLSTQMSAH